MSPRDLSDADRAFVAEYRDQQWPLPAVTVDIVVLTVADRDLKVLLIARDEPPFEGMWALPGGFVRVGDALDDQGEDLEEAARRELAEETNLPEGSVYLAQLATFGRPHRDPRRRVISVAYYALVPPDLMRYAVAGGDAAAADWHSLSRGVADLDLAFDHAEILTVALERIRERVDASDLAFELVGRTFSIAELRAVHEVVHGHPLDPGNFRRRFQRMLDDGLIEQAPGERITGRRRAKVYRFVGR